MSMSDTAKNISAIAGVVVLAFGAVGVFQTRAGAEDQSKQHAKSVNELRAEMYLARVKAINEKPQPTKDELDEKARLLALVQAIEMEKVRK